MKLGFWDAYGREPKPEGYEVEEYSYSYFYSLEKKLDAALKRERELREELKLIKKVFASLEIENRKYRDNWAPRKEGE